MLGTLVQGQDESTILRMKNIFRALGVLMVPLTASMPQVGLTGPFGALAGPIFMTSLDLVWAMQADAQCQKRDASKQA